MSEQTIVVRVEPAPADPENLAIYLDVFWGFVGIIVVLMCWKKIERIFDSNDTY
jgi:hypothetical protein